MNAHPMKDVLKSMDPASRSLVVKAAKGTIKKMENFHPLFGGDIDVPSYIAFQATPLQVFWPAVLVALTILEYPAIGTFKDPVGEDGVYRDGESFAIGSDRVPGDLGYDPLGLKPTEPDAFLEMQNKELNNGRLAMIGMAGMVVQELVSGDKLL